MIATTRNGKVEVMIDKQNIRDFALTLGYPTGMEFPVSDLKILFDDFGYFLTVDGSIDDYETTAIVTLIRDAQNFARENGFFTGESE